MTSLDILKDYFQNMDYIDFAILFGSLAEDRSNRLSDVDIGILTGKDISLPEIGLLTANLESLTKRPVDIVTLNGLYKRNPLFSYEIISKGKLIFSRDEEKLIDFKKNTLLYFMDTAELRKTVDAALTKRLLNGSFGKVRYAGTH